MGRTANLGQPEAQAAELALLVEALVVALLVEAAELALLVESLVVALPMESLVVQVPGGGRASTASRRWPQLHQLRPPPQALRVSAGGRAIAARRNRRRVES